MSDSSQTWGPRAAVYRLKTTLCTSQTLVIPGKGLALAELPQRCRRLSQESGGASDTRGIQGIQGIHLCPIRLARSVTQKEFTCFQASREAGSTLDLPKYPNRIPVPSSQCHRGCLVITSNKCTRIASTRKITVLASTRTQQDLMSPDSHEEPTMT
ncbi:hypothetical protein ACJJTC_011633 [Scirpophaga incertulas]